jgi:hypothetical protein
MRKDIIHQCTIQATIALFLLVGWQARADMVTEWNVNFEHTAFTKGYSPPAQARALAILHVAIYDAVNGIAHQYTPYLVSESAPPGARPEAAAAQAAYTVMAALFPTETATLNAELAASLQEIPGHRGSSVSIARGRAWGEYVANVILAARSTDGWSTPPAPFPGGSDPGVWRSPPTPTDADGTLPGLFPQMAVLTPFAMTSPSQFLPGPPPPLTSALYAADLNEVKAIGRVDSTIRTPDQTQLALLWQSVLPVDENRLVRALVPAVNSLVENARLFALLNIASCDSLIASFNSKYTYDFWRPYHAIRLADTDADPTWKSLFIAPRFPEYMSNHAALTSGLMNVAIVLLGDEHTCTLDSPSYPFAWTFDRVSDVIAQVKEARIWAGIHFRNSCDVGEATGRAIAEYVLSNCLLPLEEDDRETRAGEED